MKGVIVMFSKKDDEIWELKREINNIEWQIKHYQQLSCRYRDLLKEQERLNDALGNKITQLENRLLDLIVPKLTEYDSKQLLEACINILKERE